MLVGQPLEMRQQFDQSEPPTATNDSSGEVLSVQHVDAGHPDERVLIEISRLLLTPSFR